MLQIQQRASGPGGSAAGAMYLSLRIFVSFISVFNVFLFNICLVCWCDNWQSIKYIVAIDKRENLCQLLI